MKILPLRSDKLIHRIVRIVFYGLKIIGLAPVSLQTKISTGNCRNVPTKAFLFSKIGLIYNLILSILILTTAVFLIRQIVFEDHSNKLALIARVVDALLDILGIVTSSFLIVYWAFGQKKAALIMNRLFDVHFLLFDQNKQFPNKETMIFLTVHIIFNNLLWISYWVSAACFGNSFMSILQVHIPAFVIYWFTVEYSIILGILARELESLNKNLSNLKEFPNYSFHTSLLNDRVAIVSLLTHDQLAAVKLLHNIRTTLFEVSQDIADFFSLPILPCIACFALAFIYSVYHLIMRVLIRISDSSLNSYVNTLSWISITIYPLILLSFSVTKTALQAKLTGQRVHKLLTTASKREIIAELEQFSLQLIHEDVSFAAYGFFTLDFTLLQSIFGAAVTYLVIIFQFMQSSVESSK